MRKYNFSGKNSAQTQSAVAPIYTKKEEKKNKGGFLGGLGYLGEKVAAGFLQSTEGIVDYTVGGLAKLFGADAFAEEVFRDDWFGDWYSNAGEWYNASAGWKTAGDVAGGIGTSLPSMAAAAGAVAITAASGGTAAPLAAKLVGVAGIGAAGLGAAGTSTKEAYRKTGKLTEKELLYGFGSGVLEGSTEAITNALTLGGGAVAKNIGKMLGKEVTQTVARKSVVKGMLGAFAGEAFEEGLAEIVNPFIARATYDADAKNATASEIAYSALIGGLSGMVMEGANVTIDTANSFAKGANIAGRGLEGEVMELSAQIAAFEDANNTENEAFSAVAETYKKLSESLAETGGAITTAEQKKMIGDLSRANVAAVFSPMITKSAANIYANAEALAERLNAYGYKDENGNPMTYTAEEIRAGIDPKDRRSFSRALKENSVLRTLAVADVTGHLVMDTNKFKDAALRGKQIASRADLWRFAETATPEEIRAVSEALGIDNWETLTEDEFENKVAAFVQSGGADRYAAEAKEAEKIFADAAEAAMLPKVISLDDDETKKYAVGDDTIAISRKGEAYRIYDYGTRAKSREMSRAEVNKALADSNVRGQEVFTGAQDYAAKTAEIKRNTEEAEAFAREHVKGYAELSSTNKTMVRKVIRAAKAAGMSDADAATYATVSAHAGLDIVFSKKLCRVDGGYADGFYDPSKNRIVVNPEGTRSAESLLLHELDHAVRSGIREDGGTKTFAEAVFGIGDEAAQKITARYKNVESDVSKTELIWDEANAYFAETFFANKGVLESLTAKVPTLKERILAFLEGAKTDYKGTPKLEGAAARYYKQYKKMFADFAERNAGNNAEAGAAGAARYALPEDVEAALFDDEFYEQFAGESKEKITETPAELENIINSDAFKDMDYDTQFDTRAKLKAVNAGYDTLYDYYVGRRKASIAEDYERYIKTGRDNAVSRKLKEKQAAKVKQEKISAEKSDATPHKNAQFDIIQQTNPMYDEFHTGIRSPKDIKTFAEVVDDAESFNWGDFTREDAKAALEAGKIRIYSSYAIKNGVFVSTSYKQALDYAAGNAKSVHSRTVALDSVAWINGDEGQYARVTQKKNDGRRYALPEDDDSKMLGAKEMNDIIEEMRSLGEISSARDVTNDAPVEPKSKRYSRFSRTDAMKIVGKLPHAGEFSENRRNQMVTHMFNGLEQCQNMDQKIDYAKTFATQIVEDLLQVREKHPDFDAAVETLRKLNIGKGKLIFTQADIDELFSILGEKNARALMEKWGMQKDEQTKYPIDVFLANVQSEAPEFTDAIDGKTPVEALIEIDRIQTEASKRKKNQYVYPYAEITEAERSALEDKVYKGIMEGFEAADKEITAQTLQSAVNESTLFQAKLEEQTATDRDFREAMQEDFDRKAKNLNERNRETKEYYGKKVKFAEAAKKDADARAKKAKKQAVAEEIRADAAEKRAEAAEARAEKAEARAEKQIEAEEARAERVIEAYEKNTEAKLKKARERTEALKAELDETKKKSADRERGYSLRASIAARVQKLTDMKKGTFENATAWGADNFKKILSTLSGVEWRKNFSAKKAIAAMQTMNEWYKPTNTLLGYVDKDNTGLYKTDIADSIAALAALDEDSMMDSDNLKSLDEVLGYFTRLIETYNKVFYKGKWVEAKPMAEGFISAAAEGKRAMPGWIKAKMQSYLQTFGDTASVVRYRDGYVQGGFWTSMFDMMRDGGIRAEIENARIMRDYEAFMKKHPKFLAQAEKATVKFMGVEMPKMEAIALYMTMKREHAHKGLTASGFQYVTAKGETISIEGFAPDAVRDPYAGMTVDERLAKEREEASAKDAEYRKTRDEARNKAAELRKEIAQAKAEIPQYDTPDVIAFKTDYQEYIDTLEASLKEQTKIASEHDTLLKDEKEKLKAFREEKKAERTKAALDAVEAKRRELEALLTKADLEYIKILEAGFTECGSLKANRDIEKYGFTNATGGYYFPIRRANTSSSIDVDFAAELDRVSNASFNKDTVQGAAGKLLIGNADAIFRMHVKAVCQYYALSPAIDAYDRIYNMDVSGNPNDPTSVRTETQNTWREGNEFMRDLMGDIQGVPRKRGKSAKAFDKMRGGYAKFQLGLNVKTWLGQFSSGFAAMSILDYSSTVKATVSGNKISRDVDTYCDLAKLRNTDNTAAMAQGASLPGRIYGKMGKFADAMMAPMGWIDRVVVKNEFAVCQAQVAKNGGPAIGTEQNRVAAGKLLEKVILETQQNTIATERSAAMRSGSEMLRTLTMFSADSMKVFGRVIDSFGEVAAIKTRLKSAEGETKAQLKAQLKTAKRKKRKSVGALVASSVYMAFVAQFLRHLFDKEEDDDDMEIVLLTMLADTGGNLTGGLPIIRDVVSYISDGFGVEDLSLSAMNDLLSLSGQLVSYGEKLFSGEVKKQDTVRLSRNTIYSLAQTVGLPTRNVDNLVKAFNKRFLPETAYRVDSWFYEKNYQNDLYRAMEDGDERMMNMLLSLATKERIGETWSNDVHTEMLRLTTAGYKILPREVGKTLTVDGEEYDMSDEEREMVREAYEERLDGIEKLLANASYKNFTDEQKTEAVKTYYSNAYNAAISDVYGIDRGNAAMLESVIGNDSLTVLSMKTKGIESEKDKNGKTVPGSKRKKTIAAINSLSLAPEKKLLLICSKGYSISDGDVRGLTAEAAQKRLLKYIISMPGKTKDEKAAIAEMCGFAVNNGKISLKNTSKNKKIAKTLT